MWFGRLVKMPSGHFPVEVCWVCPTGRILIGNPRKPWNDYIDYPQEAEECVSGLPTVLKPDKGGMDRHLQLCLYVYILPVSSVVTSLFPCT